MDHLDRVETDMHKVYKISTIEQMSGARFRSSIDVTNLADLKLKLQELKINSISLSFYTFFDDDMRHHKRSFSVNDLSDDDFDWLLEKTDYDSRFIMYFSRKH